MQRQGDWVGRRHSALFKARETLAHRRVLGHGLAIVQIPDLLALGRDEDDVYVAFRRELKFFEPLKRADELFAALDGFAIDVQPLDEDGCQDFRIDFHLDGAVFKADKLNTALNWDPVLQTIDFEHVFLTTGRGTIAPPLVSPRELFDGLQRLHLFAKLFVIGFGFLNRADDRQPGNPHHAGQPNIEHIAASVHKRLNPQRCR